MCPGGQNFLGNAVRGDRFFGGTIFSAITVVRTTRPRRFERSCACDIVEKTGVKTNQIVRFYDRRTRRYVNFLLAATVHGTRSTLYSIQ